MKQILAHLVAACTRPWRRRTASIAAARWEDAEAELRARFLELARSAGKPRGMTWANCEWTGTLIFCRERNSGLLTAFAGLIVRFEAIAGGEMEGVEAASLPRDTTALFHYRKGRWGTGGRALFNMSPEVALDRLASQFEPVRDFVVPPSRS
jgi:hypothetical protein